MMPLIPSIDLRASEIARPPVWWRDAGLIGIVLAGLSLWLAGYPLPQMDDLFFTGASIELARSGQLVNPWIVEWIKPMGTIKFLMHPPVLPYTLALWINIFGVSTAKLTAFHMTVQTALQAGLYRLVRNAGVSFGPALTIGAITSLFTLSYGMRPEALALLLILAGQICLNYSSRFTIRVGAAFLSAGGVLTHPLVGTFVIPLYCWRIIKVRQLEESLIDFLLPTCTGLSAAFIAFGLAVGWEISLFFEVLRKVSRIVAPPHWYDGPGFFLGQATLGKEAWLLGPMFFIIGVSVIRSLIRVDRYDKISRMNCQLWLVWGGALLAGIFLYPTRMVSYGAYSGLIFAIVSWTKSRWLPLVAIAALSIAVLHNAGILLSSVFANNEHPNAALIQSVLKQNSDKVICLDEIVARYALDYNLPLGTRDWSFRQDAKIGSRGILSSKPANELWIASEWKLEHNILGSRVHAERLRIGSLTFGSMPSSPYQVKVIR